MKTCVGVLPNARAHLQPHAIVRAERAHHEEDVQCSLLLGGAPRGRLRGVFSQDRPGGAEQGCKGMSDIR